MSKVVDYVVSDTMGDITFSENWKTQLDPQNGHFVEDNALGTAEIHLVNGRKHND